jgi:hypothetical protein
MSDVTRRRVLIGGLTALLAVPLAIAVGVQRSPTWYPGTDLAQIELHVRDVGTSHTPLLGLGGRISAFDKNGSHPGPLGFYVLSPVYRLLGSSSWSLQVSAAVVNVVAIGLAVWLGHRRWGALGALGTAACLAGLVRFYGFGLLTVPWNPQLPLMWWPVVLLAAWSVLCGDLVALPLFVVAGSMCAQTHVSYVGLVGGLAALVVGVLVAWAVRRPGERRRLLQWGAGGAALGLVLWLPPIIEQLGNHPGNVAVIVEHFQDPDQPAAGLSAGWDAFVRRSNPLFLLTRVDGLPATAATATLLGLWLAAVAVAAWLRPRHPAGARLLWLHAVVGAALALGLVSISRIFGPLWPYLSWWLAGSVMLALAAVVATALVAGAVVVERHRSRWESVQEPVRGVASAPRWLLPAALGALAAVPMLLATGDAFDAEAPNSRVSGALRELAPATALALDGGDVPGVGGDGRYLVTWRDPLDLGSAGFSLLLDLERRGFDVRAPRDSDYEVAVGAHRTMSPGEADAEIHIAVGDPAIDDWRARREAEEVARYEPRTPGERAEARRLHRDIVDALEDAGEPELAATFERSRMGAAMAGPMPTYVALAANRLAEIPAPASVFVSAR